MTDRANSTKQAVELLTQKVEFWGKDLQELTAVVTVLNDKLEPRIREVERVQSVHESRLCTDETEIKNLRKVSNIWDAANSFAATILGIIGWVK